MLGGIGSITDLQGMKVLVFGAGGGGDALGAIHLYLKLQRIGAHPILGSIVWERMVVDPEPGPTPVRSLKGATPLGDYAAIVRGFERAIRSGNTFTPQIVNAAKALKTSAVALGVDGGSRGLAEGLETVRDVIGVEAVIALDSGGDALAVGCEEDLWSPLADAISIAALSESRIPVKVLAVHGFGVDGELSRRYIMKRLSEIAMDRGLIEIVGISRSEAKVLEKIENMFISEASKAPIWAFKGLFGRVAIRGGTRTIMLEPLQSATALIDPEKLLLQTPLPWLAMDTRSVFQANERLNSRCIYTELDLELDLALSPMISPLDARKRGRNRLLRIGCSKVC